MCGRKPTINKGKSRTLGRFSAHVNGFRYEADSCRPVDILYSNVKHLIACPNTSQHERFAAVHLKLHNPIELQIGAKTSDFHLYTEVMEDGEDIADDKTRRRERDDAKEEEEEARFVKRVNNEFIRFALEMRGKFPTGTVEVPFPKDSYFEGVANDQLGPITVTPNTIHTVLEGTFFIISMVEVETVICSSVWCRVCCCGVATSSPVEGLHLSSVCHSTRLCCCGVSPPSLLCHGALPTIFDSLSHMSRWLHPPHRYRPERVRCGVHLPRLHPPAVKGREHPEEASDHAEGPHVQDVQQEGMCLCFGRHRCMVLHS